MQIEQKSARRTVIDPLLLALKSRRVLISLGALVVGFAVSLMPELDAMRSELLTLVIALALALIGGISLEDAVIAARDSARTLEDDDLHVRELAEKLARDMADEIIDVIFTAQTQSTHHE